MKRKNNIAVMAQSMYLANLLILPGLSFLILLRYFYVHREVKMLARLHLYRSVQLSVLAGLLLGVIPLLYILLSDSQSRALMLVLFYFVCAHAGLVLTGMLNLARAMANKPPLF